MRRSLVLERVWSAVGKGHDVVHDVGHRIEMVERVVDRSAAEPAGWFAACDVGAVLVPECGVASGGIWSRHVSHRPLGTLSRMGTKILTDRKARPVSATVAWVVAICSVGYMLPWALAATRGKSNHWAIFWLNLLLGWSLVGWVVALVMALNSHNIVGYRD